MDGYSSVLSIVLRIILGGLFILSGIMKFLDLNGFEKVVREFHVLAFNYVDIFVVTLPAIELICGICVLIGLFMEPAVLLIMAMLTAFIAVSLPFVNTNQISECGCFGGLFTSEVGIELIIRNILLIIAAIVLYYYKKHPVSLYGMLSRKDTHDVPEGGDKLNKIKLHELILYIVVLGLVVEMTVVLKQIRSLRGKTEFAISLVQSMPRESLAQGDTAAVFSATDLYGNQHLIDYKNPEEKTLFYVFGTKCPICLKNLENWDEVADTVESAPVRIYGLTMDSLHKTVEFISKNGFRYHVLIPDDSKAFLKSYKTYGVPQTILISKQGIVEEITLGMLSEEKIKKIIEKAFS